MKKKSIILSLALTLVLGLGATVYAATENVQGKINSGTSNCTRSGAGIGRMANVRGYDILTELLKSKGATDEEINTAHTSGKSLYDLAKEKGLSDEDIKAFMVKERLESIDEAITSGKLTAEQGETAKANIQENSASCIPGEGKAGQGKGSMMGAMKGSKMGENRENMNNYRNNAVNK